MGLRIAHRRECLVRGALPEMSWVPLASVASVLAANHYLGPIKRGTAWQDEFGVIVVTSPTSRRLPLHWLELARWCILSRETNSGSRQWAAFSRALRKLRPEVTTIVSYSDPSVGHTGALYRACNWWWAPTWHRLRPPPSGNGAWTDARQSQKDRWVFPLAKDPGRVEALLMRDESLLRKFPTAVYTEPGGVSLKKLIECYF